MKVTRKLSFIALAMATVAATGLLAAPAGAAVNPNGLQRSYTTTAAPGCLITIGDMKASDSVGDIDVTGCPVNHTIRSIVYLLRSTTSPSSGFSVVGTSNTLSVYGKNLYNWTNGACGSGWWYTEGYVSFDGGAWIGPVYSYENTARYGQC